MPAAIESDKAMAHNVEIVEAYRTYSPPAWVRATVDRILSGIPAGRLSGLRTVVLTDAVGLNHDRRREKTRSRKKKIKIRESLGLYHHKWKSEPAWIELFVDNIVPWYGKTTWLRFMRDWAIGEVLTHEIGHHIHSTNAPEFREREDVADKWTGKLLVPYLTRRYWYFFPLVVMVCRAWRQIGRVLGLKRRDCRATGSRWPRIPRNQ